jgi:hypothetical protein
VGLQWKLLHVSYMGQLPCDVHVHVCEMVVSQVLLAGALQSPLPLHPHWPLTHA